MQSKQTMTSPRSRIIDLIEQDAIPQARITEALQIARVMPDGRSWRTFVDHLLLWLGGLALAFAVMFFVAYNWGDLGRFAKFGLVEAAMACAVVVYCRLPGDNVSGKVSLLVAAILLGVLLALYGQTYQTGADMWQLFFNWALLMLPWVVIGRFSALWIVWIALIDTAIVLYYDTFGGIFGIAFDSDTAVLWLLSAFNTFTLIAWELSAVLGRLLWDQWAIRLVAVGSGVPMTWLALEAIFANRAGTDFVPLLVLSIWLAGLYYIYRRRRRDLFMLAGCCLSGIVVVVSFLADILMRGNGDAGAFLFLALIVIGLGVGSSVWLKNVHREWQT